MESKESFLECGVKLKLVLTAHQLTKRTCVCLCCQTSDSDCGLCRSSPHHHDPFGCRPCLPVYPTGFKRLRSCGLRSQLTVDFWVEVTGWFRNSKLKSNGFWYPVLLEGILWFFAHVVMYCPFVMYCPVLRTASVGIHQKPQKKTLHG